MNHNIIRKRKKYFLLFVILLSFSFGNNLVAQDSSEVILLNSAILALENDSLNLSIGFFNEYIILR